MVSTPFGFRVLEGDRFRLSSNSSTGDDIRADINVTYDDGTDAAFPIIQTTSTDRTEATTHSAGRATSKGFVTMAFSGFTGVGTTTRRGQLYARIFMVDRNDVLRQALARGYLYQAGDISLGQFVEPSSGRGFSRNRALADDVTPVDIEHTLGITNALRRIDGFIWYYHCSSDSANRTLRVSMRDMGDGLPTGMTSGANTTAQLWPSAGALTLTANQEGLIYVNAAEGKIGFAVSVDNGAATHEDPTTEPDPFPYWAQENDVGEIFFDVTLAEAADRHSIYIIEEEWIQL